MKACECDRKSDDSVEDVIDGLDLATAARENLILKSSLRVQSVSFGEELASDRERADARDCLALSGETEVCRCDDERRLSGETRDETECR